MLHMVCDEITESGNRVGDSPNTGSRNTPSVTLATAATSTAAIIALSSSTDAMPHSRRYSRNAAMMPSHIGTASTR